MHWIEIQDRAVREEVEARILIDPCAIERPPPSVRRIAATIMAAFVAGLVVGMVF